MKLVKRKPGPMFKYALRVWVLAIGLLLSIGLVNTLTSTCNFDFSGEALLFTLAVVWLVFALSAPVMYVYYKLAVWVSWQNIGYWRKKALLAWLLVFMMAIFYMYVDGEQRFWNTLKHSSTIVGLAASALAVFIVKLPVETTANEG